jgi:hypothetical protein
MQHCILQTQIPHSPNITPADALIRATDSLTQAVQGTIPPPNMTTNAIDQLMKLFNHQAIKAKDTKTAQRVLKKHTQTQRVHNKANSELVNTPPLPTNKPDKSWMDKIKAT